MTLPNYADHLDTSASEEGHADYRWMGAVPDCPHCGEPITDEPLSDVDVLALAATIRETEAAQK